MKKNNKKGFTIVELVIVIAVIAILTAVLIPTFTSATEKAKESAALQNARNEYNLYVAELLEDETEDDTFYISSGDYWFKVAKGEISVLTGEPADKGSKDLTEKIVIKSFTTPTDLADYKAPVSYDEKYYQDKDCSEEIEADSFGTSTEYYYKAYAVADQNPNVAIYAKA